MISLLFIVISLIVVLSIVFITYSIMFKKTEKTERTEPNENIVDPKLLAIANIKTFNPTEVNVPIVFNTVKKLNNNFSLYLKYFFPKINLENINNNIKKTISDKTAFDIERDIDIDFISITGPLLELFLYFYLTGQEKDIIAFKLGILLLTTISLVEDFDYSIYYFDDYDKNHDLVFYVVNSKYEDDRTKINQISRIADFTGGEAELIMKQLYKYTSNNIIQKGFEEVLNNNDSIQIIKNDETIPKTLEMFISAFYIAGYKRKNFITIDSIIVNDIYNNLQETNSIIKKKLFQSTDVSKEMIVNYIQNFLLVE